MTDRYFMLGLYFVAVLAKVSSCLFHGPFKPVSQQTLVLCLEITEALLKGCYLLSACPLAMFRSLSVGLKLLDAIQTQGFYSQWQRNLFMG